VLLLTAFIVGLDQTKLVVPLGIGAFVVMLLSVNTIAHASKDVGRSLREPKQSWVARQEERWRKRFDRRDER
jgi:hypothetical protein